MKITGLCFSWKRAIGVSKMKREFDNSAGIIPFFWQYPDSWGSCIPGAKKGYTILSLYSVEYNENAGVTHLCARGYHSLPPDLISLPIEEVEENVIVALIHLLLEELICNPKHHYDSLHVVESELLEEKSENSESILSILKSKILSFFTKKSDSNE